MEALTPLGRPHKQEKVRSAWISFAGRIVAQLIGAIATVTLGVVVLGGRFAPVSPPADASPTVLVATPVRTHGETVIVMLPVGKDGKVDEALATTIAESYGKAKWAGGATGSPLSDARLRTPIDPRAPLSIDP
jgi:hypothetical protein